MVLPQVYNSLQGPEEKEALQHFSHLIIGGGAIDTHLEEELKEFPNPVWSTYGMTETLSHIALRRLNGAEAGEWYKPFDSVKVACNEEGCLVIDAPLVHEGKLVTNDIVEINAAGHFKIKGRKDNVISSGGSETVRSEINLQANAPQILAAAPLSSCESNTTYRDWEAEPRPRFIPRGRNLTPL